MATEQQAEAAIKKLKAMIEAAENSNQAGEDAVVAAAAGVDTADALERLLSWPTIQAGFVAQRRQADVAFARRALARAKGKL